jgi:hypothetical protein
MGFSTKGKTIQWDALFSLENPFFERKCVDVACNSWNMAYSICSYGTKSQRSVRWKS